MSGLHVVVSGDPGTQTGGYRYVRRIVAGLRARGLDVALHALGPGFPDPDPAAIAGAAALFAALPDNTRVVVDGLAFGALPDLARAHAKRLRLIALVHHPLALETGIEPTRAAALFASERAALAHARRVIVTSGETARALADYGVAPARIAVVEPGTDPASPHTGSNGAGFALLCVATLVPRKGHLDLLDALAAHATLPWHLRCVGGAHHDPAHANRVRARIHALDMAGRVDLLGEVPDASLATCYETADLFVLASRYEGYGMALAEALARGLPIVSTTGGAISETVPADAGLLVAPGDVDALAGALGRVMRDRGTLTRLAAGAARARLSDWETASARFSAELAR